MDFHFSMIKGNKFITSISWNVSVKQECAVRNLLFWVQNFSTAFGRKQKEKERRKKGTSKKRDHRMDEET